MAGSIIDQIWQGIVDPASNVALSKLAEILGSSLVPNTGGSAPAYTLLVQLSTALYPVFGALLVLILMYIGVSGVYRTASEGTFLGRQWGSFAVPGMVILCVILLSPIPSKNGVTVGQYVFIRGLIFGSNFADFALKKAFEVNATAATAQYNQKGEYVKQINQQAKLALSSFVCGYQLVQMGYGTRPNFFVLLSNVCKIPADATELFAPYYLAGNNSYIQNQNQQIQGLNSAFGTAISPVVRYDPSAITSSYANRGAASKELMCYFNAFNTHLTAPIESSVSAAIQAPQVSAIEKVSGLKAGEAYPTKINNRQLAIRDVQLGGSWGYVLEQAYPCVIQSIAVPAQEQYQATIQGQEPWRKGWVHAGQAIQDELDGYANAVKNSKLTVSQSIGSPDASLLNDTLQDRTNSALLNTNMQLLQTILYSDKSKLDQMAEGIANKNLMDSTSAGNMTMARIATNVYLGYKQAATSGSVGPQQARTGLTKFLDTFLGRATTATSGAGGAIAQKGIGFMTKKASLFFAKSNTLLTGYKKAQKLLDDTTKAVSSIPGVGTVLGTIAKLGVSVVTTALMPSEDHIALLAMILTAMNIVVLLPQVIMMVVLLIWLAKAAVWFMVIPLATVIIALPNTRAGHDMWKSALAIILTPLLAVLFYLISLFINDVMYDVVLSWLFDPLINSGLIGGVVNLIMQLATGELIFRFFIAGALCIAVTLFMAMMILRGPDLVSGALGLRSSSGDLGNDLEQIRGRLLDKHLNM